MRQTKPIGVSIPEDLLKIIDRDRGKVRRSVWIVDLLRKAVEEEAAKS